MTGTIVQLFTGHRQAAIGKILLISFAFTPTSYSSVEVMTDHAGAFSGPGFVMGLLGLAVLGVNFMMTLDAVLDGPVNYIETLYSKSSVPAALATMLGVVFLAILGVVAVMYNSNEYIEDDKAGLWTYVGLCSLLVLTVWNLLPVIRDLLRTPTPWDKTLAARFAHVIDTV